MNTAHALWISGVALLGVSLTIFAIALAEVARERLVKITVRKDHKR